ncbi:retrotransposon protein, putative, ty1-copia subclass [Tanacetum coccineum]
MLQELKSMFEKQARVERSTGTSWLCATTDLTLGLILNGLTKDFAGFVRNYNMYNMGKTIGELHAMLIEYEKSLPKKAETPQVMMIKGGKIQKSKKKSLKAKGKGKAKGKRNDKQVYILKPKKPKPSSKEYATKDDTYHHCKEVGHWKRNCHVYLVELLKKKKQVGSACSSGNGVRAQVEDIGSYDLVLPNVLVICLDNCHYAPSITRVSKNNVHYFNAIPSNGIYEIDMHDLVPNVNSIYNVSTKRAKHNLDSTYLWHCRLAHISKKHIEKLQQEGLLKSIDDESFDQCVSCLSGKMTRKSFPHRPERETDLLGYILMFVVHLDMCQDNVLATSLHSRMIIVVMQLTPPYTPQHNGVSERRNRTLLDMVRSMMNLKTLSLSFWNYALKSEALVKRDTPDKLQQRSVKCIFIGYPKETMGYYFYFPPENKIVVARYAEFFEKNLITQEVSGRAIDLEEIQDEDTSPSEITSEIPMEVEGFEPPQEEEIPIRRSERSRRVPNRLCLNVEAEEHSLGDLNEPTSYKAAMLDSESNKWIDAMNAEIQSMMDNMVWVLVDLPPNCKTVGSKWIFKKKTDMDGIVHTYKARLVAKGYTQLYGVDYEETFSPIADIRTIKILISIAAFYDYEIWKMDVKTTFLNGYLDEDIYMVQPEGFVDPNHPGKVCKLQRSIYGLKQSSRSWNKRFDEEIKKFGFAQNLDEPWEAAFILGIKIYKDRSKGLIGLGQNAYMDKILKRYRMDNSKCGHIPMQERLDLNKTQGASTPKEVNRMQNVPYASAVGSIMYAVRCTRPDVAFANTKDMFLVYSGNPEAELRVDCYCDVGFETDRDDTKSQTGYVFILNGGAVDWKSSKQSTTTMSATEAEYIADSEVVWIRKFISGFGIVPTINEPIKKFCDNSAALHFANEPGVQRGARHYHMRYHYVRESIALGEIRFLKVHTDNNLADPFTKALSKGKLTQHARSMGLHLASSFM